MIILQKACAQVKASRETRNKRLVAFLNQKLSGDDAQYYFVDQSHRDSFRPIDVDRVAEWAQSHANLAEPGMFEYVCLGQC